MSKEINTNEQNDKASDMEIHVQYPPVLARDSCNIVTKTLWEGCVCF